MKKISIIIILIFIVHNLLVSQDYGIRHVRVILFRTAGQRETVKLGEKVSIVLGAGIKPEYTYISYSAGKSTDEYIIELTFTPVNDEGSHVAPLSDE